MTAASKNTFIERLRRGGVLFDGGMGSMLIAEGLEPGAPPEEWNVSRPDVVRGVHAAYLAAGAEVITTNTFGATPSRLTGFGLGESLSELNNAAVRLARRAADDLAELRDRYVAFSVGPTGKMLPPVGQAGEDEIEADFVAQLECLEETIDLILGETFFDLREALLMLKATEAVKSGNDVVAAAAVGVSLTLNKTPRGFFTVMGDAAVDSLAHLEAAGADFVAVNCSIDSDAMVELVESLAGRSGGPLLCQPNAGAPAVVDGRAVYTQTPQSFADDVGRMLDAGADAVGGCCGTSPEFIRLAAERLDRS
jgi:methionine synthase I (cobalamin-dependent)